MYKKKPNSFWVVYLCELQNKENKRNIKGFGVQRSSNLTFNMFGFKITVFYGLYKTKVKTRVKNTTNYSKRRQLKV